MSPHAETASANDLMLRLLDLIERGDTEAMHEIVAEDVILDWPQTGERVRGLRNTIELHAQYPGGTSGETGRPRVYKEEQAAYLLTPMFTAVRPASDGDTSVSSVRTQYADGSEWYAVTIASVRHGRIQHITQYFAPVMPAPEWRAGWVEPYPEEG